MNLETVIDECGTLLERLDHPESHPTYGQVMATLTFKDAKVRLQGHRKKLVKLREDFAGVLRQAELRITKASKIDRYKSKAEKVESNINERILVC